MREKTINKIEQEIDTLVLEEKLALLETIIHKLKLDALKNKDSDADIKKYRGIYKDIDVDVEKSINEMRNEWERTIL
ncbi:MAG: hypothetical protein JXJ04_20600 [Spirochaetales bacterium]|nr:hypothetical protein [Spirochaetales bacterium]